MASIKNTALNIENTTSNIETIRLKERMAILNRMNDLFRIIRSMKKPEHVIPFLGKTNAKDECANFLKGECPYGEFCQFRHGEIVCFPIKKI